MRNILKELDRLRKENQQLKKEISALNSTLEKMSSDASWDRENRRHEIMDRPEYHEMGD